MAHIWQTVPRCTPTDPEPDHMPITPKMTRKQHPCHVCNVLCLLMPCSATLTQLCMQTCFYASFIVDNRERVAFFVINHYRMVTLVKYMLLVLLYSVCHCHYAGLVYSIMQWSDVCNRAACA